MEYFHSWVYPLSHELVLHSIRNPLVSGFYKLLSVTMKIAKKIKYYQVILPLVQKQTEAQRKSNVMQSTPHIECIIQIMQICFLTGSWSERLYIPPE